MYLACTNLPSISPLNMRRTCLQATAEECCFVNGLVALRAHVNGVLQAVLLEVAGRLLVVSAVHLLPNHGASATLTTNTNDQWCLPYRHTL